jgi:alpha-2-macroglobulin
VDSGNAYLKAIAGRDGNNLPEERDSAYAIYLLTRQGQVMSAEAAALRKRLSERYKNEWRQDIAAAWLAASFKLMHQDQDANNTIAALRFGDDADPETFGYNDGMTRDAFLLYVLSRHFPERLPRLPATVLETIATRISGERYHSLSAGTTLLGLDAFVQATHADTAPQLSIAEVLKDKTARPLDLPKVLMPQVPFSADARAVRFTSGNDLNAFYLVDQSGFDRNPPKEALTRGFEIIREYTDEAGHPLGKVQIGAQITVHLKFRALENRAVQEVALVDLLPGGFDLVVPPQDSNLDGRTAFAGWSCQFCVGPPLQSLSFADPREDRVVFYGTITPEIQEVQYRIKATNVGSYMTPPAYGEAMYDRNIVARSVADRVEVVRP